MNQKYQNYISGKWCDSSDSESFENRNPANWDEIVGVFPRSTAQDVDRAAHAATEAFKSWRLTPAPHRGEIIRKAGEIMIARKLCILVAEHVEGDHDLAVAGMATFAPDLAVVRDQRLDRADRDRHQGITLARGEFECFRGLRRRDPELRAWLLGRAWQRRHVLERMKLPAVARLLLR